MADPVITPEIRAQVIREELAANRIILLGTAAPDAVAAIEAGSKALVECARGGALSGTPAAVGQVCAGVQQLLKARIPPVERPASTFRAQREGLTAAGRCLAEAKQTAPKVSVVDADPVALVKTCEEIDTLTSCAAKLRATADACDELAWPRVQSLYTKLRDADEVLTPLAKRDPALTEKLTPLFDYSKGRFLRSASSRKVNAARDERTRDAVKEEVGEEVRAEVIEEMTREAVGKATDPTAAATPALPRARAPRSTETTAGTGRAAARTRRRPRRG